MVKTVTLSNGVRVIVKSMEGLLSVSMGIIVGTGSAFEQDSEDGISHFIEHMQFKGTTTRTAFEISDAFDALGAQVNAYTSKEITCYYAKSTSDHAGDTFALLSDLFLNSIFPEEEMKREKGVVVEEINMNEDTPDDLCLDLLSCASFGNDSYGRNILGPVANVKGFTREDIFAYKEERYCPENIVISFAGNIGADDAARLAELYFGALRCSKFVQRKKNIAERSDTLFRKKQIEQAHFAVSFPGVNRDHPDYVAVQVMSSILGGSMSSRLFKRVREELGLAYSVGSFTSHYAETGRLIIYAGVNPKKATDAAEAIREVVEALIRDGVTREEFARSKEQLRAGLVFAQENTASQMLLYGKHLLFNNEVYDNEGKMQEIAKLNPDSLHRVIGESFDFSRAASATVGNFEKAIRL